MKNRSVGMQTLRRAHNPVHREAAHWILLGVAAGAVFGFAVSSADRGNGALNGIIPGALLGEIGFLLYG